MGFYGLLPVRILASLLNEARPHVAAGAEHLAAEPACRLPDDLGALQLRQVCKRALDFAALLFDFAGKGAEQFLLLGPISLGLRKSVLNVRLGRPPAGQ